MSQTIRRIAAGAIITSLLASAAHAGGFNRGSANLEGLYGEGFGIYSGVTFVAPSRTYEAGTSVEILPGVSLTTSSDDTFTDSYTVPYGSVGGNLAGNTNCVGSFAVPYGANSSYTDPVLRWELSAQNFEATEIGLSCSQGFDAGPGQLRVIGGIFLESATYMQARDFTGLSAADGFDLGGGAGPTDILLAGPFAGFMGESTIDLKSEAFGYRFGFGYEIPEIALRGEVIYRSATHHNFSGTFGNTPFGALAGAGSGTGNPADYGLATSAGASASQELPQSVTVNLRSGVAPGTLVFGSVKWTDWSVLGRVDITEDIADTAFTGADFFFKDGWTVTGGAARQFNDMFAGSLSLTWDRGVTTGFDSLSDTWTVASGLRTQHNNIAISVGGAAIYFTEADKNQGAVQTTVPGEWGYAISAGASGVF